MRVLPCQQQRQPRVRHLQVAEAVWIPSTSCHLSRLGVEFNATNFDMANFIQFDTAKETNFVELNSDNQCSGNKVGGGAIQ